MKFKVLFVCTGNSCRSQMAEGLLRSLNPQVFEVYSAGIKPSHVNPKAIAVMSELGIDISNHLSQSTEEFLNSTFDWVITVCDSAKENCAFFPGDVKRIHWSFFDPVEAKGNKEEVLKVFRRVRDEIHSKIKEQFKEF